MPGSGVLSVRFPEDLYLSMRHFARLAGTSMNSLVVDAVGIYLAEHADERAIETLVQQTKEKFRETVGRLRDLPD